MPDYSALIPHAATFTPVPGPIAILTPSAGAFTPLRLPNLALWVAADRITGLTDGAAVATWSDLSGNARHLTQGTAANRPTYQTGEVNGKPVVRFDGVNDVLVTASLTGTVLFGAQQLSAWFVYKQLGDGGGNAIFTWVQAGSNFVRVLAAFTDNTFYLAHGDAASGGQLSAAQPGGWDGVYHIVECRRIATTGQIWVDGAVVLNDTFADALDPSGSAVLELGGEGGALNATIDLAEVAFFNRTLTDAERTAMKTYLADKYALTVA